MILHTVKASDTIFSISKEYSVPESRIIADNALDPNRKLVTGQTLIISRPSKICAVRGGDTLSSIASRNNISVISLLQNNPQISNRTIMPSETLNIAVEESNRPPIIVEAYTGEASAPEIERYLPSVTLLTVQNAVRLVNGAVALTRDVAPYVSLAKEYRCMPVLAIDSLDERGRYSHNTAELILNSPKMTEDFIQSAIRVAKENSFGGIEICFDGLTEADGYRYSDMLLALRGLCDGEEIVVLSPLLPENEGNFSQTEENIVDTVNLSPYWNYIWDETDSISPPAPINRIMLNGDTPMVTKYGSKILLGIPTFGVDYTQSANGYRKNIVDALYGLEVANRSSVSAQYNESTQTPYIEFSENEHRFPLQHTVCYEDARSISEKLGIVEKLALGGVNVMSLEYDCPVLWQMLNQKFNILKY